jgi:predicted nucleotidyltransferase
MMCASHPQTETIHQRYLSQIKVILTSVFKDKECAIYLFGSRAAGTHAAISDFDIAILAAEDIGRELSQAREMLELSNIPFSVDLVDLREAPAAFGRQVQTKGTLLWTN